jgi:hypothetical protein
MAEFGCPSSMHFDAAQNIYIGKDAKTGLTKKFKTLDDYNRFMENMNNAGYVCPEVSIPPIAGTGNRGGGGGNQPGRIPERTTRTVDPWIPFLEFKPKDSAQQSMYSAMSPTWQGHQAENQAIRNGLFRGDVAAFKRPTDDRQK